MTSLENTAIALNDSSVASVTNETPQEPTTSVPTPSIDSRRNYTLPSIPAEDPDPSVTQCESEASSVQETLTGGRTPTGSLAMLTKETPSSSFVSPDTVFLEIASVSWGRRLFLPGKAAEEAEWRATFHGWTFQKMVDRLLAAKAEFVVLCTRNKEWDGRMYDDLRFSEAMCRSFSYELAGFAKNRERDVSVQGDLEKTQRSLKKWEAEYERLAKAHMELELEQAYLMKFTLEMEKKAKKEMKKGRGV